MENENEEKQLYLRTKVLDAGYDTDLFVQLLQSRKGEEAADVDLWSFDELKAIVNEFIKSQTGGVVERTNSHSSNEKESTESTMRTATTGSEDFSVSQAMKVENFDAILKCETLESTEFSKYEKLEIKLSFPERHKGGFFSKDYITYLITTEPAGYKVRRRYSDFEWLKSIFNTIFPGYMIPPISKKSYGDRFNELFISKRMRFLEKFMESLIANPVTKNSQILFDFLTIENENDFNIKKKEYAKLKSPVKLSEIKNVEGEVKSLVSKEVENTSENIKNYININEVLLKKITSAHKNLFLEMNQVSIRMKEISELYSQLHFVSQKSSDNITVTDTYRMLSKLMNDWGDAEKKQSILIDIELREYFRYIKNEFVEMRELIGKMDMNKNAYYKADARLMQKKEELFKQANLLRWEIPPEEMNKMDKNLLIKNRDYAYSKMMPKETQHVHTLKENYGYYTYQLLSEFDRLRNLNGGRHKVHVTTVSSNHSDILADLHVMWADLLSYYSDVYDSNTKSHH